MFTIHRNHRNDEGTELALVLAEPCLHFQDDGDAPTGPCGACGWLMEDHAVAPMAAGTVLRMHRRPRRSTRPQARPQDRRAS